MSRVLRYIKYLLILYDSKLKTLALIKRAAIKGMIMWYLEEVYLKMKSKNNYNNKKEMLRYKCELHKVADKKAKEVVAVRMPKRTPY